MKPTRPLSALWEIILRRVQETPLLFICPEIEGAWRSGAITLDEKDRLVHDMQQHRPPKCRSGSAWWPVQDRDSRAWFIHARIEAARKAELAAGIDAVPPKDPALTSPPTLWFVCRVGTLPKALNAHATAFAAGQEAERLARLNPGACFYVLSTVACGSVTVETPQVQWTGREEGKW